MAGSTKLDPPSSNLDGSAVSTAYQNSQRGGVCSGSNPERSGSFRESSENRVLVPGPVTSRNMASAMEIPPLSLYLALEPFCIGEQKYSCSGELRRVLGITLEEKSFGSVQSKPLSPFSSEEIKRFKASLLDSSNKARDQAKSLNESILRLDKYRNVLSRKRQRGDTSADKLGSSNLLKMGTHAYQSSDILIQRLEDRTKNGVMSKRVRSSLVDVRLEGCGSTPVRQSSELDKEKDLLFDKDKSVQRASSMGPMLSDDKLCGLSPGGEGWEKKLKRKRSVGTMVNRINDDRDVKQAILPRPSYEARMRSGDSLVVRSGSSSGVTGSNTMDGSCQQSGLGSRAVPKGAVDSGVPSNERRERPAGLDKERIVAKGNKLHIAEDIQAGSLNSLAKVKASRAPRTSSVVVMNSSPSFPRSSGGTDGWEQLPCPNKDQALLGTTNRKRPTPASSSSPPVAKWVGQRPQKISRTRRVNVVSPVSNFDEPQTLSEGFTSDGIARSAPMETSGPLLPRGISSSIQQPKLRKDSVSSPVGLSESEESGQTEAMIKGKAVDNNEAENGAVNAVNKATGSGLLMKKVPLKEEMGDRVRRQGRSGRGSMQVKSSLSLSTEKLETVDTTKPGKVGRPASYKSESRVGRPPLKKVSHHKASARHVQNTNSGSSDLTGDSDDDKEELLAAANSVRIACSSLCSGSFWKEMELIFAFATMENISFLKHQIVYVEELERSMFSTFDDDRNVMDELTCEVMPSPRSSISVEHCQTNGVGPNNLVCSPSPVDDRQLIKMAPGRLETDRLFDKMIPLSHRLLSAFIVEDGKELADCNNEEKGTFLQSSSDYFPHGITSHLENGHDTHDMQCDFDLDLGFKNLSRHSVDKALCNGFTASSNSRSSNIPSSIHGGNLLSESIVTVTSENEPIAEFLSKNNIQLPNFAQSYSTASPHEYQFDHMSLNDKILIELHSIGLNPEIVSELHEGEEGEINEIISELKMRLDQQVKQKKSYLYKLEKAIQDAKQVEERNIEKLAMDKLVDVAYKKLMGGRGGSSHKSSASKMSKQLALAFARRTLARCEKFEQTGRSCFREPALWHVISAPLNSSDGSGPCGALASAVMAGERSGLTHKFDGSSFDPCQGGAKWKKNDRDKDQNKDQSTRNSAVKAGRPSLIGGRGERKTRTKPKQKIAQLSMTGNGLARVMEAAQITSSKQETPENMKTSSTEVGVRYEIKGSAEDAARGSSKEVDAIFTSLPIDELDVPEDLGGQGQDLASWLNFDDDALQDTDLVGLEIPTDDLSDLKFI